MEVVIRQGQVGDAGQLARLNDIVQRLHVDRLPDAFGPSPADEVAAWFEARLADPNARVWLAEIEGRPVGYVLALFHTRDASLFTLARRWCEVDQIAVDPTARRRGVARALVAAVAQEAHAVGVTELRAQTWSFNEASRRTFESLGFEVENVRLRRDARSGAGGRVVRAEAGVRPPRGRGRDRRDVYLDIVSRGLLNARAAGYAGDAAQAAAEADHLHNLPELLQHLENEALHAYYWECMRPSYLGESKPEYAKGFSDLWAELDPAKRP